VPEQVLVDGARPVGGPGEQGAALVGDLQAGGVAVAGQRAVDRAQVLEVADRRPHALRRHARPAAEVAVGQLGPAGEVAERADVAQRDAPGGERLVEATLGDPAGGQHQERRGADERRAARRCVARRRAGRAGVGHAASLS
jgi:hypothetical protein